jgi:uncharacterized protein involved in exopolysaccharide biosynthesis
LTGVNAELQDARTQLAAAESALNAMRTQGDHVSDVTRALNEQVNVHNNVHLNTQF